MKKMNKKGFTIVELVIVIAVIAILAGVLIPTFSSIVTKANESKALQEVKNAYTETLAVDLTTDGTDVVYNQEIVVKYNGAFITISANGEAKIDNTKTAATHEYDGTTKMLKAHTHAYSNEGKCVCGATNPSQGG